MVSGALILLTVYAKALAATPDPQVRNIVVCGPCGQ